MTLSPGDVVEYQPWSAPLTRGRVMRVSEAGAVYVRILLLNGELSEVHFAPHETNRLRLVLRAKPEPTDRIDVNMAVGTARELLSALHDRIARCAANHIEVPHITVVAAKVLREALGQI